MVDKFTTVRVAIEGEHFEILVNPDAALNFKLGKSMELSQVIAVDQVYSDASKGQRASTEKLMKYFKTSDTMKAAEAILKRGDLQITIEQRRRLTEEKRKQIVALIARDYVDPRSGLPHPPVRIEQALQEVRVSIDPLKGAEEQSKLVVEQLRTILALKSEHIRLLVKVPPQFASQSMGLLRSHGEVQKEEWGADGSLTSLIEIPAGVHPAFLERLGSVSKGTARATVMR